MSLKGIAYAREESMSESEIVFEKSYSGQFYVIESGISLYSNEEWGPIMAQMAAIIFGWADPVEPK
jgi:hypothetical protein